MEREVKVWLGQFEVHVLVTIGGDIWQEFRKSEMELWRRLELEILSCGDSS
jgi:hypothetical protein